MGAVTFRKVVLINLLLFAIAIGGMLCSQALRERRGDEERRIANQSWNAISDALRDFRDAKGYYPGALNQLPLDQQATRNFRYWTNANGGYSLRWDGKYGFSSMSSTSKSNGQSKPGESKHSMSLTNGLTSVAALEIARQAVSSNDTWIESAEFEKPEQRDDGSWVVLVWRRPSTLGGHRLVMIGKGGKVVSYSRGK
jgi:hypothetical protein